MAKTTPNGTKITILREGEVWVKRNKTDPEATHYIVREIEIEGLEGKHLEHYHTEEHKWVDLPINWTSLVKWTDQPRA